MIDRHAFPSNAGGGRSGTPQGGLSRSFECAANEVCVSALLSSSIYFKGKIFNNSLTGFAATAYFLRCLGNSINGIKKPATVDCFLTACPTLGRGRLPQFVGVGIVAIGKVVVKLSPPCKPALPPKRRFTSAALKGRVRLGGIWNSTQLSISICNWFILISSFIISKLQICIYMKA